MYYTLVQKSRGRSNLEMSQIGPSLENERFFLILRAKCLNAVARGPPVTIWPASRVSTTWIILSQMGAFLFGEVLKVKRV